jgi:integrase
MLYKYFKLAYVEDYKKMVKIFEVKGKHSTYFEVYRGEAQEPYKMVSVTGMKKVVEEYFYYLIIDSQGKSIKSAFTYLNVELGTSSFKKREQAFTALKFLYSYCEVFNIYEMSKFGKKESNRLLAFLRGGDFNGVNLVTVGLTIRSNKTIKNYLGVYRYYFEFSGIKPNIFKESIKVLTRKGGTGLLAHTQTVEIKKYTISPKVKIETEVPSYISFEEYEKTIKVITEEYTIREKIICRLMYEYGLRIGEVLGLTLEDFGGESNKKGKYKIVLRNRVSDKPYQYDKGCMNVISRNDYQMTEYQKQNFGYQEIVITDSMGMLIQEYIDNTRSPFSLTEITSKNLTEKNIADKVTDRKEIDKNQYILISKNYTPITSTAWNLILKSIFLKVGIEIDKGKKKQNLNHRFRHGFAMFKITVEGYDPLRLTKAMRHTDTNSINYYFKPTEEDRKRYAEETERLLKNGGVNLDE